MKDGVKYYFVIGSSRGLGAALVEEFLNEGAYKVFGVARTNFERIHHHDKWVSSEKYSYVELDITASKSVECMKAICAKLPQEPICVIFNAALVKADINENSSINYAAFEEINRVGIGGLGNVLRAFEEHLLTNGGVFVGISSFSALAPPLFEQRVAYPASKAYLDMALRCLRLAWGHKVKVVTVHLGHIGDSGTTLISRYMVPTYEMTAMKMVRSISGRSVPEEINYPPLYCIVYKYIFAFVPDAVYLWLFRLLFKFTSTKNSGS